MPNARPRATRQADEDNTSMFQIRDFPVHAWKSPPHGPIVNGMETLEEKIGDVKVLHLRGRLDFAAAPDFETQVKSLISAGESKIVLDCRDLKYVSSSGLGAFIACGKTLPGGGAIVFAGLSNHIESLFEMTGITGLFPMYKTKQDALRRLGVEVD